MLKLYRNKDDGMVKEIDTDTIAEWKAANNPKALVWEPYTPPGAVLAFEDKQANLIARLAEKRWQRETGGFQFMGKTIMSDRESQASINALYPPIQLLGDDLSTVWKCKGGEWLTLDKTTGLALYTAGFQFVASLFSMEKNLQDRIAAATTEEELASLGIEVEAF